MCLCPNFTFWILLVRVLKIDFDFFCVTPKRDEAVAISILYKPSIQNEFDLFLYVKKSSTDIIKSLKRMPPSFGDRFLNALRLVKTHLNFHEIICCEINCCFCLSVMWNCFGRYTSIRPCQVLSRMVLLLSPLCILSSQSLPKETENCIFKPSTNLHFLGASAILKPFFLVPFTR